MEKLKLLQLRKAKKKSKPKFLAQDSHKKKRIRKRWVRPRGLHSKIRLNKRGYRKGASQGYRSPKLIRHYHQSGLLPVIVADVSELAKLDKEKQGIVIASNVGTRKKVLLVQEAKKQALSVLNVKDLDEYVAKVEELRKRLKEDKLKKQASKSEKKKELDAKKKEEEKKKVDKDKEKPEPKPAETQLEAKSEKEASDEDKKPQQVDAMKEKKEKDKILVTKTQGL